jgi:hypothetical protein
MLKLESNIIHVNLPFELNSFKHVKIRSMRYITKSADNEIMAIRISGLNQNYYYDGVKREEALKFMPLPNSINTLFMYDGNANINDSDASFDNRKKEATKNLNIEIAIKSRTSGFESIGVDYDYPVFLELVFF